jgi:hypothetical protein
MGLTFMEEGARAVISFCIRSEIPAYLRRCVSSTPREWNGRRDSHGGSSRHDNVTVEVLSDVEVTLHDRVVGRLVDTSGLKTEEGRLEESLGCTESTSSRFSR